MPRDTDELPVEIARDAGSLIAALRAVGWTLVKFRFDAAVMGNWHIDLAHEGHCLQIVRDRSQFFVTGPSIEELKAAGLWCAFDDATEFHQAVINWAFNNHPV